MSALVRHIALVGFMAAGKTTIGRRVAAHLGVPFVDTDDAIVELFGPIPDLFAREGEAGFRAREFEAVRATLDRPPSVIALGGGAVTYAPTRALLAERATRVYLEVPVPALVARLRRSRTVRPLVGPNPSYERVRGLLDEREPIYRECEITVRGARRSKDRLAEEIAATIRAREELLRGEPTPTA